MSSNIFKRFSISRAAFTLAITFTASTLAAESAPNELIVKFKPVATDAQIADALKVGRLNVKKHTQTQAMKARGHNGVTLTETGLAAADAIAKLKGHPAVDYAEPNYTYKHQLVSNDPYVIANYTWGLYGNLSTPANTFGSGAAVAWGQGFTGSSTVYVAVIDEGIDSSHPELAPNIWTNSSDPVDGIDNDGNGYVDDTHGWNFLNDNNKIFDTKPNRDQHGTHVSGTIGAKGGNGIGVAGVNWNVQIISGKFLGPRGGSTLDAAEAIDYFVDLKSRQSINLVAINASWGGGGYSQTLHDAIIRAAKAGILFCGAAGNDGLNNDVTASYPSNIDSSQGTSTETAASYNNMIAVAAIDSTGALASFSNYGSKTVHIGAPGVQILSTFPNSQLANMSGTSMATPHVTGAVALYASTHPGASAQTIRNAIVGAATATASLSGKTTTGGRLNLSTIIMPAPAAPTGVTATASQTTVLGVSTVTVVWSPAAGATSYKVYRMQSNLGTWVYAGVAAAPTFVQNVTGSANYTFNYKIVAVNVAGESPESAIASVTPVSPAPGSASATALSASEVQLTWADRSSDETNFKIEVWNYPTQTWIQVGVVDAGVTTATITGLNSKTIYSFRVKAYNAVYTTLASNTATTTTL